MWHTELAISELLGVRTKKKECFKINTMKTIKYKMITACFFLEINSIDSAVLFYTTICMHYDQNVCTL